MITIAVSLIAVAAWVAVSLEATASALFLGTLAFLLIINHA
jgi:hypothetical protein